MKITQMPIENQPQVRLFTQGPDVLNNAELIALILRTGLGKKTAIDISNDLLQKYPLDKLPQCTVFELKEMLGIGNAKASQIVAMFELARRSTVHIQRSKREVKNSKSVFEHYKEFFTNKKQEHLYMLLLDSRKRIITEQLVSLGTVDTAIIHPREIMSRAVSAKASSFIIVHNHPSGDATPSQQDIAITKQIEKSAEIMDIPLLDHIIIGEESYYSMRDMGIIG